MHSYILNFSKLNIYTYTNLDSGVMHEENKTKKSFGYSCS